MPRYVLPRSWRYPLSLPPDPPPDHTPPSPPSEDAFALADRLLESGPAGPGDGPERTDFGEFRLQRRLGRGGMGDVWLAWHHRLEREVAIKFLLFPSNAPDLVERFAAETKLLARLEHPNIARIYDAGWQDEDTPYFVMEYVDGEPLDAWCRERRLPLTARLTLFREVCAAVQYAHGRLVLHRDLKPANVLVTPGGAPKLLDFGIAKQLPDSGEAVAARTTGGLRGTPAYAAPEQFRGEPVGVYTDVYALGVMLYELLTGARPFAAPDLVETSRLIAGDQPAPPASENFQREQGAAALPAAPSAAAWADLDVLCARALHKDPNRRYASAGDLAADVDRFLNGEPLKARPDRFTYRAGKFLRRNRAPLAAATALLLLIAGLTLAFTRQLARARDQALTEAARARRIQSFMLDMYGGADQQAAPGQELRVTTMIDRAIRATDALAADPATRAELHVTLGRMEDQLGKFPEADRLLQQAYDESSSRFGATNETAVRALAQLSMLRVEQNRYPQAVASARSAYDAARAHQPVDLVLIADTQSTLGRVLTETGHASDAIPLLTPITEHPPPGEEGQVLLLEALTALGVAEYNSGQFDHATTHHQRALELDRARRGRNYPRVATDLANLAAIDVSQNRLTNAVEKYREAADIMSGWYGPEHPSAIQIRSFLALALVRSGQDHEASVLLQDVLGRLEASYGKDHANLGPTLDALGRLHRKHGRLEDAMATYERALQIYRTRWGLADTHTALAAAGLADTLCDRREYARAVQVLSPLAAAHAELPAAQAIPLARGTILSVLGRALLGQQQAGAAATQLATAGDLLAGPPAGAIRLRQTREYLATAYDQLHQPEKAAAVRHELKAATEARPEQLRK